MTPCPTPPVCEFGKYGCEAMVWWDGRHLYRTRYGGVHAMCGHRPLTELERLLGITRGDRMGPRPEVDRVNVVPCDGTRR